MPLTRDEFDQVFNDHMMRNPAVRGSFMKLPPEVRENLQDEWCDIWTRAKVEAVDLHKASRVFLEEPDHPMNPGIQIAKHPGRLMSLAKQLSGERRSEERGRYGNERRQGCDICKGSYQRKIRVVPFGKYREWAVEHFGEEHWKAARAVMLICPCNVELTTTVGDDFQVDPFEDHFPRRKPRADNWSGLVPTVYDDARHEREDFEQHWRARCIYNRDVLGHGRPRQYVGPNPASGSTMMGDVEREVFSDVKHVEVLPLEAASKGRRRRGRPEPVGVSQATGSALGSIRTDALISEARNAQLPTGDRDDIEDDADKSEYDFTPDEPGNFLGMSEAELDEAIGAPNETPREARRRKRRRQMGLDKPEGE